MGVKDHQWSKKILTQSPLKLLVFLELSAFADEYSRCGWKLRRTLVSGLWVESLIVKHYLLELIPYLCNISNSEPEEVESMSTIDFDLASHVT